MTASAIYEGVVTHRRHEPIEHAFTYRVCMLLLDLDELPGLFDGHPLWSARRPAPGRFRRQDHFGDPRADLAEAVRDEVARQTGARPDGPVRVLATPRTFGHAFNPVRFYYCGDPVTTVLAEVTNTPWGERHAYVMDPAGDSAEKAFHVSPFMGMDHRYTWRLTDPGERIAVRISSDRTFDAALALERRSLTRGGLTRVLARYPAATAVTLARIYGQALRLKAKGAPYFPHPSAGGAR
ncbi:MAG: DUF1365 domain-containing protein [Solirubrobacteraceae bacterium]|nr:DUF1365 domain-containing protein [Solirubrobacteraceae bacterium]